MAGITLSSAYEGRCYQVVALTGVMAAGAAANSEIVQFRWLSTAPIAKRCRILSVAVTAVNAGAGFTAGIVEFDLKVARAWSAPGTGGGVLTLSGNNAKFRTTQLTSFLSTGLPTPGEIRVATTAPLGAGTKTFDAQNMGTILSIANATAFSNILASTPAPLYTILQPQFPTLVLADQEGFSVLATVPATGTWTAAIVITWAEID
jgi:hypothetical protein